MFKHVVAAIFSVYLLVAGFNYTTSSPQESVYLITTPEGRGNGSGILIAPNTLLTAKHVADVLTSQPLVVKYNGVDYPVSVFAKDPLTDLALLSVPGLQGTYTSVASEVPSIGTNVIAVGYPMYSLIGSLITTEGKILARVNTRLMSSTPILPGNSGGGLFQRNWFMKYELVGVTVSAPVVPFGWTGIPVFHLINSVPTDFINLFLRNYGPR